MAKNRTESLPREGTFGSGRSAPTAGIARPWAVLDPRARLLETVLDVGFTGVMKMLEDEREALCGPVRRWHRDRRAYRYGFDEGRLVLGGRKVRVPRPRVRSIEGREIELETWKRFAEDDPLSHRVLQQILAGVSTRGYRSTLEEVAPALRPGSTSRSSVSARFVAVTQSRLAGFLSRSLDELDVPVIMLDGVRFGRSLLVVGLGIDRTGTKHVLGVTEGTTESEEVCRGLLSNLLDRGLVVERARLFVVDGGKGLRKAIRSTFGPWALVQRCHVHKARNVAGHLPKHRQAWVRACLRRAWSAETVDSARRGLRRLADQLEEQHPGAAASIREGLDETLTLIQLGVHGALARTLCSTNPIENMIGSQRRVSRNVKRWRGGRMAMRWAVTGLIEASKRFRRLRGYRDMPTFVASLEALVSGNKPLDNKEMVA